MNYKEMISGISPDSELINETLSKMNSKKSNNIHGMSKPIATLLAVIIIIMSTTALAAGGSIIFENIARTDTYDGIKLTVTDVNIKENEYNNDEGVVLLSLTDTEGKGRVTEKSDLNQFDFKGFKGDCKFISYDSNTQTANYRINVRNWNGGGIPFFRKRARFDLNSYLKTKKHTEAKVDEPLINLLPKTSKDSGGNATITIYGNTEVADLWGSIADERINVSVNGIPTVKLTNLDYCYNHLHIKLKKLGDMKEINKYSVYLKDNKGNIYKPYVDNNGIYYSEFGFKDIPCGKLNDYELYITADEYDDNDIVMGDWEVSFNL